LILRAAFHRGGQNTKPHSLDVRAGVLFFIPCFFRYYRGVFLHFSHKPSWPIDKRAQSIPKVLKDQQHLGRSGVWGPRSRVQGRKTHRAWGIGAKSKGRSRVLGPGSRVNKARGRRSEVRGPSFAKATAGRHLLRQGYGGQAELLKSGFPLPSGKGRKQTQ